VHPRREPCTEIISNINNAGKIQEAAATEYMNHCFLTPLEGLFAHAFDLGKLGTENIIRNK
jgi:hypothetical protein